MIWLCLALVVFAFLIAVVATRVIISLSHRAGAFDSGGVPGQVKEAPRRVPNTGGIAIVLAIVVPMLLGLWWVRGIDASPGAEWRTDSSLIPADLHDHIAGIQKQTPMAMLVIGCVALLHILGLIDDRKPLGPFLKLGVMAAPALAIPLLTTYAPGFSETRLLTFLDGHAGGPWLSIAVTTLWFLVVTNAMNFIDNMDGLSGGVAAVAGSLFLAATLINGQWFVAAVLALLVGACLGFLVFNAPRPGGARIFMGDGGSIVLGFLLAFLTTRTTYFDPGITSPGLPTASRAWYAAFMPLVVLAVPLYDFLVVTTIRLSRGRSPFVGDLGHLSHRLVRRGLSKRGAVLVIWGITGVTGVSGVLLSSARPWQAVLIGVQVCVVLAVVAALEYASRRGSRQ